MGIKITRDQKIINFWKKVCIGGVDECWNWKGSSCSSGYGNFSFEGHTKSHRVSWVLTFRDIPKGLCVCHKCDNPSCVNPYHLFLGTNSDNIKDMWSKGRGKIPRLSGEKCPSAKLKESQVVQIRNLCLEGISQSEVSRMFGVTRALISLIVKKQVWK